MECVSVQAYPFRKTVRAKRQQWSASACYKLAAKWREEGKNLGSFFLGVFRLNAACQKWRFITSPKETTFSGWWKHDCPDVCSTVTVITLGARRCPTPLEKRGATCQQKAHFRGKGLESVRAEHPVHHSEVLWMATKASETLAGGGSTLPKANASSTCQVLNRRQENPSHTRRNINKTEE